MTDTATPTAASAVELLTRLVDDLSAGGALADDWRPVFLAVPRHLFVPDLAWHSSADGRRLQPVHRAVRPESWLEMVYRDEPVITQFNDGTTLTSAVDAVTDVDYTSSTSMPTVVAEMLIALHAAPGMNVLELGTGTANTGRDDCSTRSAPPTNAGRPPANHRHTPGGSPSPQTANTPNSPRRFVRGVS